MFFEKNIGGASPTCSQQLNIILFIIFTSFFTSFCTSSSNSKNFKKYISGSYLLNPNRGGRQRNADVISFFALRKCQKIRKTKIFIMLMSETSAVLFHYFALKTRKVLR